MTLRTLGTLALATAGAGLVLVAHLADSPSAVAGCLAPADVAIDSNGTAGPFWGNDSAELLYSKLLSPGLPAERDALMRREGTTNAIVVEANQSTGDVIGTETERFRQFHAGAMNESGDLALVTSTGSDEDDPATTGDDRIARRALFHLRGNTWRRVARFADASPVLDQFAQPVPWASIFDAGIADRLPNFVEVYFSAQLAKPDERQGLFLWSEESQSVAPLVLAGSSAPAGGEFTAFGRLRVNGAGDAAFFGVSQLNDDPPVVGLYVRLRQDGIVRLAAKFGLAGDAAEGGVQSQLKDFDLDDDATVVFASVLSGTSVTGGLFRQTLGGAVTTLALDGDASPLGGTYDGLSGAIVRVSPAGEVVFGARLSDDLGGDAVFTIPAGGMEVLPLAATAPLLGVAALGSGRAAYQDEFETHTLIPADGSQEGPNDFRIAKLTLKNAVRGRADVIKLDGRFRLPPFGGAMDPKPLVFRSAGTTLFTPDSALSGADLEPITRAIVQVSDFPGNTFTFDLANADTAPTGSFRYNEFAKPTPKVKLGSSGRSATWVFKSDVGNGKLLVDLDQGRFLLKVSAGALRESFLAEEFLVSISLLSADDVAMGRDPEDAVFHHALRIDADQTGGLSSGLGVKSRGERVPGGTLFVDAVTVKRKLKTSKGQAAPTVTSDDVTVSGTLRICPGSTPPTTPGLSADLTVGDLVFTGLDLARKGRRGSKYVYKTAKGATPRVDLRLDVVKGTFVAKVKGAAPLPQLVNADFSGSHPTNDSGLTVGGMLLPFHLSVARVYEGTFDVPVERQRKGKKFTR